MAWGETRVTRQFIRYARDMVPWMHVSEARTDRGVVARVATPFYGQDLFVQNFEWWSEYEVPPGVHPALRGEPSHLCSATWWEADVAIRFAAAYLTNLQIDLVGNDDFGLEPKNDGRNSERLASFRLVVTYLQAVAHGLRHREKRSQQLAAELLEYIRTEMQDVVALSVHTHAVRVDTAVASAPPPHEPPPPFEPPPPYSPPGSRPTDAINVTPDDDEDSEEEAIWRIADEAEADFALLDVAGLCRALDIQPHFGPYAGTSLCQGNGDGLTIADVDDHVLLLTSDGFLDDLTWELRVLENVRVSTDSPVVTEFTRSVGATVRVAGADAQPAVISDRVMASLKNLADRTGGGARACVLAGMLSWAALTDRAPDFISAMDLIEADDNATLPDNVGAAARRLAQSGMTTAHEVAELRRRIDYDAPEWHW